jgi:hypothetical protein
MRMAAQQAVHPPHDRERVGIEDATEGRTLSSDIIITLQSTACEDRSERVAG